MPVGVARVGGRGGRIEGAAQIRRPPLGEVLAPPLELAGPEVAGVEAGVGDQGRDRGGARDPSPSSAAIVALKTGPTPGIAVSC